MKDTITLSDIPLPSSEVIERQVLADAIGNADMLGEVVSMISADSFTSKERKYLWELIVWMYNNGQTIDMPSIFAQAGKIYTNEELTSLIPATATTFLQHVALLRGAETRRRAYYGALTILQQSTSPTTAEDDIFAAADALSGQIKGERHIGTETPLNAVIEAVASEIERDQGEAMQGKSVRIRTSIPALDYMLYGGFGRGQLIVLAARPSVGKTSIMLQFAKTAATEGFPASVYTLEMTKEELGRKLLFSTGKVRQSDIVGRDVAWDKYNEAVREIGDIPLYIDDGPRTLDAIASHITTANNQGRCKIAFIDYLGLMRMDPNSRTTLAQQIGFITSELKNLAKRLKIPIVLLVQLNRDFAKEGESSAPQLIHLRDSGNIEQDADIVLMLAREGDKLALWVRKNRNGAKDIKIPLQPDPVYSSFTQTEWPDKLERPTTYTIRTAEDFDNDEDAPF